MAASVVTVFSTRGSRIYEGVLSNSGKKILCFKTKFVEFSSINFYGNFLLFIIRLELINAKEYT